MILTILRFENYDRILRLEICCLLCGKCKTEKFDIRRLLLVLYFQVKMYKLKFHLVTYKKWNERQGNEIDDKNSQRDFSGESVAITTVEIISQAEK